VVADGAIGQMMEPAELPPMRTVAEKRPAWALTGALDRDPNLVTSIRMGAQDLEAFNLRLQEKLATIREKEIRYEELYIEDAQLVLVAYGTAARVAQSAVKSLRDEGLPVGLLRPITLWPFPEEPLAKLARRSKAFLVVEMNAGQMLHDVRAAVTTDIPIKFVGRMGGVVPMPDEIEAQSRTLLALFGDQEKTLRQENGNGHRNR
jgi:2-oxoglutarate ferredoxin oxidoreductase subunit alpha